MCIELEIFVLGDDSFRRVSLCGGVCLCIMGCVSRWCGASLHFVKLIYSTVGHVLILWDDVRL